MRNDPLVRANELLGVRRWPVVKALLLGLGGSGSALALAALSAWLITRAWQMPPVLTLSVAVTSVRALGISRGLFRYLERLATHDLALEAMGNARARLYRALAQASPSLTVGRRGEILVAGGARIDEIGDALIRGVLPMGIAAVTSLAAVVVMAMVSVVAAVVLAVALVLCGVVGPMLAARGSRQASGDSARARRQSIETTHELLTRGTEFAVSGRRLDVLEQLRSAEHDERNARTEGDRIGACGSATLPLAILISVVAAMLVGVELSGTASPMAVGVLLLLPLSAFETAALMTDAGLQLQRSRRAAVAVMDLLDDAQACPHPAPVPEGDRIVLDNLEWGWPGGERFGPLSATVHPGQHIAICGPSGTGKSTLLLTLAGVLEPLSGTVQTISGTTLFAEDAHIFGTSVRENLLLARGDASDAELAEVIDAVGLTSWVRALPEGIDTAIETDTVSGGQRRRLLLARAMLSPASVLLLDEPTEHLDAADSAELLRHMLTGDRTTVLVTHQLPADHGADAVFTTG